MNASEAAILLGLCSARDRRTVGESDARAWAMDLDDIRLVDAQQAVSNHFRRSNDWIMPKHIRDEVRRIRDERLEGMDVIQPPDDLSPWGGYLPWLRATRRAIADGEPAPQPEQLRRRDMPALDNVFRHVPGEDGAA